MPDVAIPKGFRYAILAPSDEGKRSAVAVVNASPVDWQSRDRARRSELSKIFDFGLRER